jgi:exodeoxyribonuclease V alpha subunit
LNALLPSTRLVLLGDKDQLASVEAGAVLGDLCREADAAYRPDTLAWIAEHAGEDAGAAAGAGGALAQHIALLRVSHRFRDSSGIGQLALAVNAGRVAAVKAIWHGGYGDIAQMLLAGEGDAKLSGLALGDALAFTPSPEWEAKPPQGYRHYLERLREQRPPAEAAAEVFDAWGLAVLAAFDQFQLLCALRRGPWGVDGLNRQIADSLHRAGLIAQTLGWYEGRPVLVTRNDYSLGLMNGDIGIALNIPDRDSGESKLRVAFRLPDHSVKWVLPSRLTEHETVYAMTVHKSQGSEFAQVGLVLPDKPNPVLTRELVYTGVTRARQWFTLLAPDALILGQAVARQVRRSGGLAGFLAGEI